MIIEVLVANTDKMSKDVVIMVKPTAPNRPVFEVNIPRTLPSEMIQEIHTQIRSHLGFPEATLNIQEIPLSMMSVYLTQDFNQEYDHGHGD